MARPPANACDTGSGYAAANSWVLAAVMPDVAFSRRRSPSSSVSAASSAPQQAHARSTIKSNTGCGSPGDADITFSTSIVAACCAIRSPNSLLRSASSAVCAASSSTNADFWASAESRSARSAAITA